MSEVIVIGSGGHSRVVIDALQKGNHKIVSVFDSCQEKVGASSFCGVLVEALPGKEWWDSNSIPGIIAIGSNLKRREVVESLPKRAWAKAVHPSAIVHHTAKIGQGVYIGAKAIIQPNAIISDHAIINTGAIVEHDSFIGEYCHICPGAVITGSCHVSTGVLLGASSTLIPEKKIGEWSIIGAGSVIVQDIPPGKKAYGVPCQIID